ncbi:MAG: hypothetical protein P8O03_02910 [Ilumatobacter sp.]|nr:hypothetical protein [bacterium]MDG1265251.1 hypothetical protein [Ilumatobacter sp.]NKB41259.1 hypothetical protein [Ilumatobacter sp.]
MECDVIVVGACVSGLATADLTGYSTYGDPQFSRSTLGDCLHWILTEMSSITPGHIEDALADAERTAESIRTTPIPRRYSETR